VDLLEERLAKLWMTGFRKSIPPGGSPRSAWAHPQDLVKVIQEELITCISDEVFLSYLIRVAWLHDILEDGWKSEGIRVTEDDLRMSGVEGQVIQDVVSISRKPGEDKGSYLARLIHTSMRVRLLKCIDRTCNLREAPKKDAAWWDTYSASTRRHILPLARSLHNSEGWDVWATSILEHALTLRPSQRMNQVTL
jgi:hypothetical protein